MSCCKPTEFDAWVDELGEIADGEGLDLWCIAWLYSAPEPCAYLEQVPGLIQQLMARARWSDGCAGRRDLRRVS